MVRSSLPMRRRVRIFLVTTSCAVGCLITSQSSFQPLPPVTPPVIVDEPNLTVPRLGNLVIIERSELTGLATKTFTVPVDDDGLDDPLQYQFFVNTDRDCLARDGGTSCKPVDRLIEVSPNGMRRRIVGRTVNIPDDGCNRVELWVSSRFRLSGNYRTPEREGDVASATWWIFVRPRPGTTTDPDAGTANPVEQCRFLVQP